MVVDRSALAEQVTFDVITSAFDSAGQRCSALRILCLQEDIADHQLAMLKGALAELTLGRTDRLAADIGPVISAEAKATIEAHVETMRARGCRVERLALPPGTEHGTFVAPTIIEIASIDQLGREVFGPVLHVIRYRRDELDALLDAIRATGYGLTFGLHTRLDETLAHVTARAGAGNIYVNRNVVGAVVGVQPFGGRGLSGTGPKAGGPLYLHRLVSAGPELAKVAPGGAPDTDLASLADWLERQGDAARAGRARALIAAGTGLGGVLELPGPVGERNLYALHPRGRVLLLPESREGLLDQLIALLASGNHAVVSAPVALRGALPDLPTGVAQRLKWVGEWLDQGPFAAALIEASGQRATAALKAIAALDGPIPLVQRPDEAGQYRLDWLVEEVSTSINTTAAGGNANLMALV
jgi:RHH-type proline utilization regulon transcriptional repressor/proline dehydrogenase/delta 1-pyrroline-5-carboxylate dehydrogenase